MRVRRRVGVLQVWVVLRLISNCNRPRIWAKRRSAGAKVNLRCWVVGSGDLLPLRKRRNPVIPDGEGSRDLLGSVRQPGRGGRDTVRYLSFERVGSKQVDQSAVWIGGIRD